MTVSFLRDFAPTQHDPSQGLGMQPLPTGRHVYRTGKVDIGIAHVPATPRDIGVHAERVQDWILGSAWSSSASTSEKIAGSGPVVVPTRRNWWQRLVDFVRGAQ